MGTTYHRGTSKCAHTYIYIHTHEGQDLLVADVINLSFSTGTSTSTAVTTSATSDS